MSKSRVFASAAFAGVLVVAGLSAGPAFADDPLDWQILSGYPAEVGDFTISWEVASSTTSPFDGTEMLDAMPALRPNVVNNSSTPRYIGYGTDFEVQGEIDLLWTRSAWGAFGEVADEVGLMGNFWDELLPDSSLISLGDWPTGMPSWSGHTITLYELSEAPIDGATPTATAITSYTTPGRFVPADLSEGDFGNLSAVLGQQASVDGGGSSPQLFAGLAATVTASNLTPDDELELWIAPGLNYAYFQILGGGLPTTAIKVGGGKVAENGTLSANFALPIDLEEGSYQLVAGVRAERFWPAGSYDDFTVLPAPPSVEAFSSDAGPVDLGLGELAIGQTALTLDFPAGTTPGTTTAIVSPTGPLPIGFTLATEPPLYFHLRTTSDFGAPVSVCVTYDQTRVSPEPRLYHFDSEFDEWVDITTTQSPGEVCGETASFSPFTLGYPPAFDFSGFFNPVSMTAENIAKPGQAIPVKFSLQGNQGLDVVTSARFVTEGNATSLVGDVIDTTTPDGSGLTYDSRADQYTYVWKTPKTLSLKTGRFELTLSDGTVHSFNVTFKK